MKAYILTLKHDNGTARIRTCASSEQAAIDKVIIAEGCPRCAIVKIEEPQ